MKRPLAEQVIVISGASSGIGRALARGAGARGAKVVVSARNVEALERAVGEVDVAGGEGLAVPGDATSEVDAESLCARAVERFGRIDTFVATVMVTVYAEVEQLESEELRRVMDVNFLGRAHAYRAALPHLKATRGTFIDVNSGLAYRGIRLQAAYCASKAAARAYVRVSSRRAGEAAGGRRPLPDPPRRNQHAAVRPRPAEARGAAAAGAADLSARDRRRGDPPLRRAPAAGAAGDVGGAEAPLGPEALAPRRRPRAAPERLEGAVNRRAEAGRLPRHLWETIPGDPGAHGRFDDRARSSSAWMEARLRLGKTGSVAVLTLSALAGAIGYHAITKRR